MGASCNIPALRGTITFMTFQPPPAHRVCSQVVTDKAGWDQRVAEVGRKGLIMFGHYEHQTADGRYYGVLYTCADVFENVKRACDAYGPSVLFVLDGKQKV